MTKANDIAKQQDRKAEVLRQIGIAAAVCLPAETEVFIYGSQANLEHLIPADIDLGLLHTDKIPMEALADFMIMLDALPILYQFDVTDFRSVSDSFRSVAMKNVEYLDRYDVIRTPKGTK
ncbi:nucleotidyltransferase domain-containing protein [Marinoscillum furvescens]|uniref:Polymerase beta nucleotidyltransferase domain-containing protein n=1 Tax=Marinoscillum furvescens DSM 4134 TaxID=1122208 RepID=A0A3D9LHJ3_MARFU|nr:hypothetical protein [Marinoscillum furvescens]REE05881.1 hypothetical protein C7460_101400 [Marinoscillum furvescens DSM 4134]